MLRDLHKAIWEACEGHDPDLADLFSEVRQSVTYLGIHRSMAIRPHRKARSRATAATTDRCRWAVVA